MKVKKKDNKKFFDDCRLLERDLWAVMEREPDGRVCIFSLASAAISCVYAQEDKEEAYASLLEILKRVYHAHGQCP